MLNSDIPHLRTIDIVIYPEFKSFEAIGPMTVFTYANKHLEAQDREPGYKVRIVSTKLGPVVSDTLMTLTASHTLGEVPLPHSVMVVGAHEIERIVEEQPEIVEWTKRVALNVERFAALCSGAFFLAEAGLLNGKRATTHWRMAEVMKQNYPEIQVDIDSIFVRQDNLWTSAGVSASVDLALAFVESDFGHDLALQVARDLVIFLKRPGGQSQFSANLKTQMTQSPNMRSIQEWVLNNIDKKIGISLMASRASMSLRHFTRTFQKDVGMCPSEFLERARIDKARRLLSESELPLKSIAFNCGFSTTDQMRISFRKHLSVTPKEYRERFLSV
ncbi:GlxA family transcriptional regulator [Pseudomonas veronii]|uniref:GlxA family transcriptional regulator n=1 Tax=Pseudomonas veronii TaxID=76761 RepID=UPI0021BEC1B8|nr:GlxA family transcriptional regulator [Pseudomonas veronii]MCT8965467.1 GlxA family transcriptional regulator [Pseudomonas veronii]